jgi:metal-responsive CopG/Arc/MetJ family transcriptional regulator
MQTLAISEELQRRLDELWREGGYESREQCLAQVVDGQLVELRR